MSTTKTIPGLPDGYKPGLEGVIAGVSEISEVNAERDALIYRGYPAHELAENSTFSEVAYLFLHGKLPTNDELEAFRIELNQERTLPDEVIKILKCIPKNANSMTSMQMAVAALQMFDPDGDKIDEVSNLAKAKRLIAKAPLLVAACYRFKNGLDFIPPNPKLRHAANFLYMVTGKEPDAEVVKFFDATMILYTEHGFNASTFSSLVTASTLSDMHSAIAAAIGTLKGPLHGGANEKAVEVLLKIGDEKNVEAWLKDALAKKEKIMGFGHRVYRKQDSRAPIMKMLAEKTANRVGDKKLFPMSVKLEDLMMKEKKLFPNVDYHCGVFYYLIGLPLEVYTPIFAMSRMVGWTSHVIEQQKANRLIRPKCFYSGAKGLKYVPIDQR